MDKDRIPMTPVDASDKESGVRVYASGIFYCSVCAPKSVPVARVVALTNELLPTGIQSAWELAQEPFRDGSANPHVCEKDGERLHYLMHC